MAHFAEIDENNTVTRVIVVNNAELMINGEEDEQLGIDFCKSLYGNHTNWVQTSYNNSFRNIFAGPGYMYVSSVDAFVKPKPFNSWSLNLTTLEWDPPVPLPDNENTYIWDEGNLQWCLVSP